MITPSRKSKFISRFFFHSVYKLKLRLVDKRGRIHDFSNTGNHVSAIVEAFAFRKCEKTDKNSGFPMI